MKRREFISLLGGAAAWPLAARAQQAAKQPTVGVLWHAGSAEEKAPYLGALQAGLKELGHVEGRTIILENRFAAEQYDRFNTLADELVRLKVDVLVAVTRPAALAARRATLTIPIVFVLVPDPVASSLVESLARPGGNVTGLSQLALDLSAKRVELLKHTAPSISRVAVLVNPSDEDMARRSIEESRTAAAPLQVSVEPVEARTPSDLAQAFSFIIANKFDGLIVTSDPMFFNERGRIAEWAMAHRLPTMMFNGEMARSGGLMAYSANNPALFRRAATFVDKLLKGAKPADLPVELPTKFELLLNLKTANSLGLTVPDKLLALADEVIE
jgi:putative ABC transport system substrate-binding protein